MARTIRPGDVILGLASNGLHTNGYSLARKILFEKMGLTLASRSSPACTSTLGDELLRVHRNYQPLLASLPPAWSKALAHITGGGLVDNLPRVLPANCDALIEKRRWKTPPIFRLLQERGKVSDEEMFHVFNMGIGIAVIVPQARAAEIARLVRGPVIGAIAPGSGVVRIS